MFNFSIIYEILFHTKYATQSRLHIRPAVGGMQGEGEGYVTLTDYV